MRPRCACLLVTFTVLLLVPPASAQTPAVFAARWDFPLVRNPNAIISEDFDGDNYTDLAIGIQDPFVSILMGNGDGTFRPPVDYDVFAYTTSLALGDFDNDNEADLAVGTYGEEVRFLYGNGDGTFTVGNGLPVNADALSVLVEEMNGDAFLDIVVGCDDGSLHSFTGAGGGTFVSAQIETLPYRCYAIDISDFDEDGKWDLAVAVEDYPGHVAILLGNGDGTFQPPANLETNEYTFSVAVADFNEDGDADVAAGTDAALVHVFLGNGDGSFGPSATYPLDDYVYWLERADYNGDGHWDLAGCTTSSILEVLIGNGDGSFRPAVEYLLGAGSYAAEAGSFDHDGQIDIAVGGSDAVSVFMGRGEDGFVVAPSYETADGATFVAVGHFNPGTIEDLAVSCTRINPNEHKVSILLGNSDGSFQLPVSYDVGGSPVAIAAGGFDGDDYDDVVTASSGGDNLSVLLGNGDGTLQPAVTFPACNGSRSVAVGQFNADVYDDLVVACGFDEQVAVFLGNGDGSFQAPSLHPMAGPPRWVDVGDLNGDTHLDIVAAVSNPSLAAILFGNGDGTFEHTSDRQLPDGAVSVTIGDVDADGARDLVATGWSGGVWVLINEGEGTFAVPVVYGEGADYDAVDFGNIDGDRSIDLVAVNAHGGNVRVFFGNGDGTFTEGGLLYGVGRDPANIVAFDADDDGLTDAVTSWKYPGGVSVLMNILDETPVEGAFHAAVTDEGTVLVQWTILSLDGVSGLNVYRGLDPEAPFELLNDSPIEPVPFGEFEDEGVWPETTFYYQLRAVLVDGTEEIVGSGLWAVTTGGVLALRLAAPWPNPTSGGARFEFDVPAHSGAVTLAIYDVAGRRVEKLVDGPVGRGRHTRSRDGTGADGRPVASGVYFARLEVGEEVIGRRLVLVR